MTEPETLDLTQLEGILQAYRGHDSARVLPPCLLMISLVMKRPRPELRDASVL